MTDREFTPDEIVNTDLLAAIGLIVFSVAHGGITKSELIRILHNAGLTDDDIAALYRCTHKRVTNDEIRPI